eukprot:1041500-Amphidinium_carterae.1
MSEARGCRLSAEDADTLRECGSLWPGAMLDKDTFMELLANLLGYDFKHQISEWEKQLIATGALGNDGKVDVQLFVGASSADPDGNDGKVDVQLFAAASSADPDGNDGNVDSQLFAAASSADPDAVVLPEVGLQALAPTSRTVSQTAALQADASEKSKTMTTTT